MPYATDMTYDKPPTETLTTTEFRDNLGDKLDAVQHTGARLTLTRKGRNSAAVIPLAAYQVLRDAEYSAEFSATVRSDVTQVTGFNNITLDSFVGVLEAETRALSEATYELAGGDAAAVALLLAEYRAAHTDNDGLCRFIDNLLRRTHLGDIPRP